MALLYEEKKLITLSPQHRKDYNKSNKTFLAEMTNSALTVQHAAGQV